LGIGPLPEKAVNLSIAMRLARLLAASGIDVVTTRSSDHFIPLDGRAEIAERNDADLFVSIHADTNPSSEISGATIYIARDASALSRRAAGSIVNALGRGGVECRGIRRAGFRVLVGHSRPAVLVECGYLSNAFEARRLSQPGHQAKVAAALAEGITNFLSR
jgi:N-acetylmuramoyl-L-alanine amidase